MLRGNWLLKHVIEGKIEGGIEVTVRRGRRRKQVLHELKERRHLKLEEETIDRPLWRTRLEIPEGLYKDTSMVMMTMMIEYSTTVSIAQIIRRYI